MFQTIKSKLLTSYVQPALACVVSIGLCAKKPPQQKSFVPSDAFKNCVRARQEFGCRFCDKLHPHSAHKGYVQIKKSIKHALEIWFCELWFCHKMPWSLTCRFCARSGPDHAQNPAVSFRFWRCGRSFVNIFQNHLETRHFVPDPVPIMHKTTWCWECQFCEELPLHKFIAIKQCEQEQVLSTDAHFKPNKSLQNLSKNQI